MAVGKKTGGRTKGVPNKVTAAKAQAIAESGLTPLDYLLDVMRNVTNEASVRIDAAKAAAPYCHARLSNVEFKGEIDATVVTRVELVAPPGDNRPA